MNYYLVTINIADDKYENFKRYEWVCANLKTAIKCAKHKAFVYDFKPLNGELWEGTTENHLYKPYDKGYISIDKYQMWEKEGD